MWVSQRQWDSKSLNHSAEVKGFVGEDHAVLQAIIRDKYWHGLILSASLAGKIIVIILFHVYLFFCFCCPHFIVEETEA